MICITKNCCEVLEYVEYSFLQGNAKIWKLQMTDGGKENVIVYASVTVFSNYLGYAEISRNSLGGKGQGSS